MNEIECAELLPPEGQIVFTVIDDGRGRRNEQCLKRRGGLYYHPDDSMYVYYAPTHWRPATVEELQYERDRAVGTSKQAERVLDAIDAQIDEAQKANA